MSTIDRDPADAPSAPQQDSPATPSPQGFSVQSPAPRPIHRLVHGPSRRTARGLITVAAHLAIAIAIPAIALSTPIGDRIEPLHAFGVAAAQIILAFTLGNGWRGGARMRVVRPAVTAGVVVAGAIGVLAILGIRFVDARGLLVIVLATTVAGVLVRVLGKRLFRPREVMVTAVDGGDAPGSPAAIHSTADAEELASRTVRAVDANHADVVRVPSTLPAQTITEISWALRNHAVPVQVDLLQGTVHHSRVIGSPDADGVSVLLAPPTPGIRNKILKRAMDIVGSSVLLLLFSPILLGTALAIRLDDGSPVLFRQTRIGKDGKPFQILKFRSMAVDADARLRELLRAQKTEGQPLFKVQNDPRLTRIGAFIRRYSIDELPQLFNVLGGTMSLVGPRPQRDAEVALYTGTDSHRLGVAPGMTGLWQVSGRSNLSWDDARRLDVHYAHNWSVALDLSILLRTAKAVLGKDGAY